MAIYPARGDGEIREGIPASAFSRGDILCLNSSSSLSRMPDAFGLDIAGVALADSTKSINNKVTYAVPGADQIFWADTVSGSTASFAVGSSHTLAYSATSRWHLSTATGTGALRAVVVAGTVDIDQSVQSRALFQFIRHDGNVLFS